MVAESEVSKLLHDLQDFCMGLYKESYAQILPYTAAPQTQPCRQTVNSLGFWGGSTPVETVGNLARGNDFSLGSVDPMNGLVMAWVALPPQAGQTVVGENRR